MPFFFLVIEVLLFIYCYEYDLLNQSFLIASLGLASLALLGVIVVLLYKRTIELTSDGYRERSQLSRWVLWEEHYPLQELVGFESFEDPEMGYRIDLRLINGERLTGLTYLGNADVKEIANRLNILLSTLKVKGAKDRNSITPDL